MKKMFEQIKGIEDNYNCGFIEKTECLSQLFLLLKEELVHDMKKNKKL